MNDMNEKYNEQQESSLEVEIFDTGDSEVHSSGGSEDCEAISYEVDEEIMAQLMAREAEAEEAAKEESEYTGSADVKLRKVSNKIRENTLFNIINTIFLVIISVICILPFLNVFSTALSTGGMEVNFTPKGFTLENFKFVFEDIGFWRSMGVSFMVVVVGTVLSVSVMFAAAYALSKPDFPFRKTLMVFFIITMIISGGMVPNYILVKSLGLARSPLALILPSVVQTYNLILIKNYLEGLPAELEESAKIDGANNLQTMFHILLPVSGPCVASVSLFTGVTFWNNYTSALLYLGTEETWYPLSLYILNYMKKTIDVTSSSNAWELIQKANIESAMVILSILPILIIYPFVLKFFTKGVTVGAVKG